jgi:hypothetical protein
MLVTVGDIVSIASIFKVGASLGASLDEIKSNLPALTKQALDINAEITKLQTMPQMSQTLQIDLSAARDNERQDVSGDHIQALDITGDLYVRFNQQDSQIYNLNQVRRLNVPFDVIFLSNDAQAGKVATLVLGKGGLFQIQDVSPTEINIIASEVTLAISIESSTIMMPIDIQSSYIMMPVDIQAQYMNLAIDIVAQTIGNIKMDIAAQTIGNVDITIAGQIDNVSINLQAQNVGIQLNPEWQVKEGLYKHFSIEMMNIAVDSSGEYDLYTVPTGKKLYVWGVGVGLRQYAAANYANRTRGDFWLYSKEGATYYPRWRCGAEQGNFYSLSEPLVIPTGGHLYATMYNRGPDIVNLMISPYAIEVPV